MKKVVLFIFLAFITLKAGDLECKALYLRNELDPDLKAVKGWKRVCNNDKLENYLTKNITPWEKKELCNCLASGVDEDREIYLVKSNTNTNPNLGGSK